MKNSIIYSIAVIALGYIGLLIDHVTNAATPGTPGMLIWILAPMIVSFALRAFAGDGWRDLGWQAQFGRNSRTYFISLIVYPVILLPVLAVDRFTGLAACPPVLPTPGIALRAFAVLLIPQLVQNTFEESGFRGYLTPKLLKARLHPLVAHVAVGFVWGLWHLPYLRVITPYADESLLTLVPRFLVGTIAASLVLGELRRRSRTFWPAVFAQTIGGAMVGAIFALGIGFPTLPQLFMPVVEGGLVIVLTTLIGVTMWRRSMVPKG